MIRIASHVAELGNIVSLEIVQAGKITSAIFVSGSIQID